VLGMRVDDVTFEESLSLIEGYIRSGGCHRVVTPNPEFTMATRRDPEFRAVVNGSSLAIPDGIGLMLATRLAGHRMRQHVRGTDLVHRVAALCAREGYRVFLLGAAPGVAEAAGARLAADNPGLQIAGSYAGSHRPEHDDDTVAAVRRAGRVDVLLVAYGAPAQERWLARNQAKLGIPCGVGVGGVFNFLSGRSKRAPAWIRKIEMEWLYRLMTEPWRWRRQMALPAFVAAVVWDAVRGRKPVVEVDAP
ncbi:MAG: WecB/TagA/CpsF family glycosyltransferase, partial [Chloroflexota bacterium]